jgi:uncharacterized damage-inducible protein DinB
MLDANELANAIEEAVTGPVWHGPSLTELLDDITAADAAAKPVRGAHSIWELVLHLAAWASIVQMRLIPGPLYEPTDDEDWPRVPEPTIANWRDAIVALGASHHRLAAVVRGLENSALSHRVPDRQHSVRTMVRGVVEHAAYHGGQIALLLKAIMAARVS